MALKQYVITGNQPPWLRRYRYHDSNTRRAQVYNVVKNHPDGVTRNVISADVNLATSRVSLYLSELMRAGYVEVKGQKAPVDPALMAPKDAALNALAAMEGALISNARANLTPEMEKGFARYQKLKEMLLRPGTEAEGKVALRMALIDLIKLVF